VGGTVSEPGGLDEFIVESIPILFLLLISTWRIHKIIGNLLFIVHKAHTGIHL
jgi:hypothetical protein